MIGKQNAGGIGVELDADSSSNPQRNSIVCAQTKTLSNLGKNWIVMVLWSDPTEMLL